MMSSVDSVLASLGLSPNEIAVYKVLLQSGLSRVVDIASKVDINRSTTQFTCQQLHRKGLVTMVRRKNAYLYAADDVRTLMHGVETQRLAIEKRKEELQKVIPELESLRTKDGGLPRVFFYEGYQRVAEAWHAFLDTIPEESILCSFSHPLLQHEKTISGVNQFVVARRKRKIFSRVIACDTPSAHQLKSLDTSADRETRIMNGCCCRMENSEILFYDRSICLVTVDHESAYVTLVENAQLSGLLRASFEHHWQLLEPERGSV
jgi:sugar-specific transcriptional regulator TrmB